MSSEKIEEQISASTSDKPSQQYVTTEDETVLFDNPFDWPNRRKWFITVLGALCAFTVTFSSSVFSSTIPITSQEFNTSETVMLLGIALYVLGFATGPFVWGPLSEVCGRRLPLFIGYGVFALMQIPVALAPNLPAIFICRFLAGAFGAAPMVIVSAIYADFWEPAARGVATALYSVGTYAGPTCGPVVGSFVTESYLGWRWTAWITLIMATTVGVPAFIFIPETYAPVLKERTLKKSSAGADLRRTTSAVSVEASKHFFRKFLLKPAIMLAQEPMLLVMTLYTSMAYGIM